MGDPSAPGRPPFLPWARRFLAARFDRTSQVGIGLTISAVVFALAIWALSGLLDGVLDNQWLVRVDRMVESWFHAHATPAGLAVFSGVTLLGSPVGVAVLVVVVALYLWRAGARLLLWAWLGANAGGALVGYVLKTTVHRTRPQYAAAYLHGHSYSFPSGHTMGSTVCYLLLAYLISSHPSVTVRARRLISAVAVILVGAIGFSRLYLGVPYPSDVLGGFMAGLAWLAACEGVERILIVREGLLHAGWSPPPRKDDVRAAPLRS
jgi:membrane-associated phospholipid phosphatase